MHIERVTQATDEVLRAMRQLIPQLTNNNPAPSFEDLRALLKSESSILLVARGEDHQILGVASLTIYRVPTGIRAIIEDVIVDAQARGQGMGEQLVRWALEEAKAKGAPAVTLTSNPKREAANRLYQRMGFVIRNTNAYVYKFK